MICVFDYILSSTQHTSPKWPTMCQSLTHSLTHISVLSISCFIYLLHKSTCSGKNTEKSTKSWVWEKIPNRSIIILRNTQIPSPHCRVSVYAENQVNPFRLFDTILSRDGQTDNGSHICTCTHHAFNAMLQNLRLDGTGHSTWDNMGGCEHIKVNVNYRWTIICTWF